MAGAFASHCLLKVSHKTHSASRDWDPSDSSHTLHSASLVLDWAEGHPHPPLSTGGAGRSWHESSWQRGSEAFGALQVDRAGREHVPSQSRLRLCLWKSSQHWMPGLVALMQAEVVPGKGLPPPAVFGGTGTIILRPRARCSLGHVRAQRGHGQGVQPWACAGSPARPGTC